jgi:hypothetical protein
MASAPLSCGLLRFERSVVGVLLGLGTDPSGAVEAVVVVQSTLPAARYPTSGEGRRCAPTVRHRQVDPSEVDSP